MISKKLKRLLNSRQGRTAGFVLRQLLRLLPGSDIPIQLIGFLQETAEFLEKEERDKLRDDVTSRLKNLNSRESRQVELILSDLFGDELDELRRELANIDKRVTSAEEKEVQAMALMEQAKSADQIKLIKSKFELYDKRLDEIEAKQKKLKLIIAGVVALILILSLLAGLFFLRQGEIVSGTFDLHEGRIEHLEKVEESDRLFEQLDQALQEGDLKRAKELEIDLQDLIERWPNPSIDRERLQRNLEEARQEIKDLELMERCRQEWRTLGEPCADQLRPECRDQLPDHSTLPPVNNFLRQIKQACSVSANNSAITLASCEKEWERNQDCTLSPSCKQLLENQAHKPEVGDFSKRIEEKCGIRPTQPFFKYLGYFIAFMGTVLLARLVPGLLLSLIDLNYRPLLQINVNGVDEQIRLRGRSRITKSLSNVRRPDQQAIKLSIKRRLLVSPSCIDIQVAIQGSVQRLVAKDDSCAGSARTEFNLKEFGSVRLYLRRGV